MTKILVVLWLRKKVIAHLRLWPEDLRLRGHQSLLFPCQWCMGVGVGGAGGNCKTTLID